MNDPDRLAFMGSFLRSLYLVERAQPRLRLRIVGIHFSETQVRIVEESGVSTQMQTETTVDQMTRLIRPDGSLSPAEPEVAALRSDSSWTQWIELHYDLGEYAYGMAEFGPDIRYRAILKEGSLARIVLADSDRTATAHIPLEETADDLGLPLELAEEFARRDTAARWTWP